MSLPTVLPVNVNALKSIKMSKKILGIFGQEKAKKISLKKQTLSGQVGGFLGQAIKSLGLFFKGIVGAITGFLSWAVKGIIQRFRFSLVSLVGVVQQAVNYIWNFNWAATDKQLDQQLQSQYVALTSQLGGTLGNAAGYLICGGVANASLFVFNPLMGVYVAKELGEEALEEFCGNAIALAYSTSNALVQTAFIRMYQSNRALFQFWKNNAGKAINAVVPGNISFAKYVEQKQKGEVVSFADFVETSIESIKNPYQKAFYEEFFEEFGDACWESLYIVAGGMQAYMAEKKMERANLLGDERYIEITPNREIEKETLILAGREEALKPQIVQTLATYQQVENRDIGQIVGTPVEEHILANPFKGIRVNLILFPYPQPPFYRHEGVKPQEVRLWVPDVDRSTLDWEKLKAACGGSNGYTWGRFRGRARLDNGRSFVVLGASETEVENQIERMLALTDAKLLTMSISDPQKKGVYGTNPKLQKEPRQVYPGYAFVVNRQEYLDSNNTKSNAYGNFRDKKARLPLYTTTKPPYFDEKINELLTKGFTQR